MNRMLLIAAGVAGPCVLAFTPSHAALAPNYQRLAEMRDVLESPEVATTFDVRRPWSASNISPRITIAPQAAAASLSCTLSASHFPTGWLAHGGSASRPGNPTASKLRVSLGADPGQARILAGKSVKLNRIHGNDHAWFVQVAASELQKYVLRDRSARHVYRIW